MNRAKQDHEKFLRKMGCLPEQLKSRKKYSKKLKLFGVAKDYYGNLTNSIAPNGVNNSLWEKLRTSKESPLTLAQISVKRDRVAIGYNKGGLQYLNDSELKTAGRKV